MSIVENGITVELTENQQQQVVIQPQQPAQVFLQPQQQVFVQQNQPAQVFVQPELVQFVQPAVVVQPPPEFKTLTGVGHPFTITVPDAEWGDFSFTQQIHIYCVDTNSQGAKEPKQKLVFFNFQFRAQFDRNATLDYVLLKPNFKAAGVAALNATMPAGHTLVPVSWGATAWNGYRIRQPLGIYLIKESKYDDDYPLCCCCCGYRTTRTRCIIMWAISPLIKFWFYFFHDIRGSIDNKKWQIVIPTVVYFPEKNVKTQNLNAFTKLKIPKDYENLSF